MEPAEPTLAALADELASRDLRELAARPGVSFVSGPPEGVRLDLFGQTHLVSPRGVETENGAAGKRATILLLNHLVGPKGMASGNWTAYPDLPEAGNTVRAWRACLRRLARAYAGRLPALDRAAHGLGAREASPRAASRCYALPALPGVEVRLRFWDRVEDPEGRALVRHPAYGRFTSTGDFDARAEILLDSGVVRGWPPPVLLCLLVELVDRLAGP